MRKERLLHALCIFFLISIISLSIIRTKAQRVTVHISPPYQIVQEVGLTFTINITVQNVKDLYGWAFTLHYPNDILNGTAITEGPLLKTGGVPSVFTIHEFNDKYNETHGIADVYSYRIGDVPGVDGNGVLAVITFKSTSTGGPKKLHFSYVNLVDSNAETIACTILDGEVEVIPEFPNNMAVTSLILLAFQAIVLIKILRRKAPCI